MKYLVVIFTLVANTLLAQKIINEKIPKGQEGAGRIIETEVSKDTIWIRDVFHDNTTNSLWIVTKYDFEIEGDTAIYISKEIPFNMTGRLNKSKWLNSVSETGDGSKPVSYFKTFAKSIKAIRQWQLAIIKEKYPSYYAKWLTKK